MTLKKKPDNPINTSHMLGPIKDQTSVDPRNPKTARLMKNIQGNILKGHGRDHTANIFLQFTGQTDELKTYLGELAKQHVTTCYQQLKEREIYKRNKRAGGLNMYMFFTRKGLEKLHYEEIEGWGDKAFNAGMAGRDGINDPKKEDWESGFQKEVHCLIMLADDNQERLCITAKDIINTLTDAEANTPSPLADILTVEYGHAIRNANGDGLEHNGYVDGVSQPLFLKDEIDEYLKFHDLKLNDKNEVQAPFNPIFPLGQVLVKDPLANGLGDEESEFAYGSYFVFRKLEQNVRKFKQEEAAIGYKLFPHKKDAEKRELAGAWLVGRFEDGTPVEIQDEEGLYGSGAFNNFNYSDVDPSDGRCPYFAHIRKSNPRTNESRSAVMARRGIPFGHRDVSTETNPIPEQTPEGGVGLLFMSYQASLVTQFEKIQKEVNVAPNGGKNIDPIIGQNPEGGNGGSDYQFPNNWNDPKKDSHIFEFNNHITMKGGEYFFAPSIPFLQSL